MLYFNTNSRQKIVHTAACFHILHTDIERIYADAGGQMRVSLLQALQ